MEGDAKFAASQDVPDFDYAAYARLLGLDGMRVKTPQDVPGALEAALSSRRPFVLDVEADPDVPPLPPHISFEQAAGYMSMLLSGDPDAAGLIRRSLANLFPGLAPKIEQ